MFVTLPTQRKQEHTTGLFVSIIFTKVESYKTFTGNGNVSIVCIQPVMHQSCNTFTGNGNVSIICIQPACM